MAGLQAYIAEPCTTPAWQAAVRQQRWLTAGVAAARRQEEVVPLPTVRCPHICRSEEKQLREGCEQLVYKESRQAGVGRTQRRRLVLATYIQASLHASGHAAGSPEDSSAARTRSPGDPGPEPGVPSASRFRRSTNSTRCTDASRSWRRSRGGEGEERGALTTSSQGCPGSTAHTECQVARTASRHLAPWETSKGGVFRRACA